MVKNTIRAAVIAAASLMSTMAHAWEDPPFNAAIPVVAPLIACNTMFDMNRFIDAAIANDTETLEVLTNVRADGPCSISVFPDGLVFQDKLEERSIIKDGKAMTLHIFQVMNPQTFYQFIATAPELKEGNGA